MRTKSVRKTVDPSRFDRLAGVRRNRRLRNAATAAAGLSFIVAVVLILDPIVAGTAIHIGPVLGVAMFFVASLSIAIYFHMRFLTRE